MAHDNYMKHIFPSCVCSYCDVFIENVDELLIQMAFTIYLFTPRTKTFGCP